MKTKPIPIALPLDLLQQVDEVQHLTGMSKADIMRLCMRIGLVDLRAAEHDIPGIVKQIADDKGVSFTHFVNEKQPTPTPCAPSESSATSLNTFPSVPVPKAGTAKIVTLPPSPMLTVLHNSLGQPSPPKNWKQKRNQKQQKNGTED